MEIKDLFKEKESVKTSDITITQKNMRKRIHDGKVETIIKTRKKIINIYLPKHPFDVRIAISVEKIVPNKNLRTDVERKRDRETFKIDNLQFDFTIITDQKKQEIYYEFETEMIKSDGDLEQFIQTAMNISYYLK